MGCRYNVAASRSCLLCEECHIWARMSRQPYSHKTHMDKLHMTFPCVYVGGRRGMFACVLRSPESLSYCAPYKAQPQATVKLSWHITLNRAIFVKKKDLLRSRVDMHNIAISHYTDTKLPSESSKAIIETTYSPFVGHGCCVCEGVWPLPINTRSKWWDKTGRFWTQG